MCCAMIFLFVRLVEQLVNPTALSNSKVRSTGLVRRIVPIVQNVQAVQVVEERASRLNFFEQPGIRSVSKSLDTGKPLPQSQIRNWKLETV